MERHGVLFSPAIIAMRDARRHPEARSEPRILETLKEDVRRGDFIRTLRRESEELKEFMFTEERRSRLGEMRPIKRWLISSYWLLKLLVLKLTPFRRILLLLGLIFLISIQVDKSGDGNTKVHIDTTIVGAACILFVLLLELKDKLVAKEELQAGRSVQEALMPERSPEIPGWQVWLFTRPANDVGGDLVDLLRLGDRGFGVSLGDVAGKGLSAALFTAKLQATLNAIAPDYNSLAALGTKLSTIYRRDGLRKAFASLIYAEFKSDSGLVRFLNAGHIPPLVIRAGAVENLEKGGPALGIVSEAAYAESKVELGRGEIVLLYSDGVVEAQNPEGNFFGEGRLLSLAPTLAGLDAAKAGQALLSEVDRFIGTARAADDLSIAILKRL
jgi:phosphoserine phosphatase RsbU/P